MAIEFTNTEADEEETLFFRLNRSSCTTTSCITTTIFIPVHNPLDVIPKDKTRFAWFPKCIQNLIFYVNEKQKECVYLTHKIHDYEFTVQM